MDGDGFDVWGSQPSANRPAHAPAAHAGLDLNSQVPVAEGFSGLGLYGAFLQSNDDKLLPERDELLPGRVKGSGFPPYRAPRAGAGDRRATVAQPYARQLNFGGSSSAAASRGGGNRGVFPGESSSGAGGGFRLCANSATTAPGRRSQRTNTVFCGGGSGQHVPRPRATRAPRSVIRGQASGSGAPIDNGDEELEDDVEELASSGGPPQRAAGTYNGAQMTGEGYQAIVDGLLARKGLVYTRLQVKNQIGVLKNTHSFWRYMQAHTGLGRKPNGSIDADSEFWITNTEKKTYLKKLQWGPPANEDLLDQLFRWYTVDGSTSFVPGDAYGENLEQEEEEEFQATPTSSTTQMNKRNKRSFSKHFHQSSEEEQEPNGEDCGGHSQYLQRVCRNQH
ncbi:hypothetical protein C2845_PM07G12220 [Panicum miliaceum]|uniref:Myb/SANT-like domain-containing protein n=1 Tax=Panicum miliaceum TaxID=4540 RepID=A0A3L6SKM4_PANMI|nr:hypothetical protein C2845_PM07G12220 [Panicum miliaceum]